MQIAAVASRLLKRIDRSLHGLQLRFSLFLCFVLSIWLGGCTANISKYEYEVTFQRAVTAYDIGDYQGAFEDWKTLSDRGDLAAKRNVAHLYRKGLGVEQNPRRAFTLYKQVAIKGLPSAQINLATMYLAGEGTRENPKKAVEWYRRAASVGHPSAIFALATLYESGHGVDQDPVKARELFNLAYDRGFKPEHLKIPYFGAESAAP